MTKKKPVKKVAGPGRKTCPNCGEVVGARRQACDCGHTFAVKRSQPRSLLSCSIEELEAVMEAKRKLAEPLKQLIDQHGGKAVLAEVKRLSK